MLTVAGVAAPAANFHANSWEGWCPYNCTRGKEVDGSRDLRQLLKKKSISQIVTTVAMLKRFVLAQLLLLPASWWPVSASARQLLQYLKHAITNSQDSKGLTPTQVAYTHKSTDREAYSPFLVSSMTVRITMN